jgi:hypothetical protein
MPAHRPDDLLLAWSIRRDDNLELNYVMASHQSDRPKRRLQISIWLRIHRFLDIAEDRLFAPLSPEDLSELSVLTRRLLRGAKTQE